MIRSNKQSTTSSWITSPTPEVKLYQEGHDVAAHRRELLHIERLKEAWRAPLNGRCCLRSKTMWVDILT